MFRFVKFLPVLALLVALTTAVGFTKLNENTGEQLFEGDILLNGEQQASVRSSTILNSKRWPNGQIPYWINTTTFTSSELYTINYAIKQLNSWLRCAKWVPLTTNLRSFVRIHHRVNGCFAYVGQMLENQPARYDNQELNLGRGCVNVGIIQHEMLHSMGIWHEQSRSDRDKYVQVNWQNIIDGQSHNFNKHPTSTSQTIGSYNYGSLMHYEQYAFTKSRGRPTLVPKKPGITGTMLGGKSMQQHDVDNVNRLYGC